MPSPANSCIIVLKKSRKKPERARFLLAFLFLKLSQIPQKRPEKARVRLFFFGFWNNPLSFLCQNSAQTRRIKAYRSTYRRTFFFRRRRFLRFWTLKLTFTIFSSKNQYFVVDWSRRVFTGEKVSWPAAYSRITLNSRHMAKIPVAAYPRKRLISEYIRYIALIGFLKVDQVSVSMESKAKPRSMH